MGKRKKLLGLVLVVCMLFTLAPTTARADVRVIGQNVLMKTAFKP